jgi:hypothetical protein
MWGFFKHNINEDDAVEAFTAFQQGLNGTENYQQAVALANKSVMDVAVQKNQYLANVGNDWEYMQDANGNIFMVRKGENGQIEVMEDDGGVDEGDSEETVNFNDD